MPKIARLAVALVLLLLLAPVQPAGADSVSDARKRRDAAAKKRRELATKIDALKATDHQLENAVRVLDRGVATQASDAAAAQQAVSAASSLAARAEARLKETERRLAQLRTRATEAAVRAYVHPSGDALLEIVRARDLGEASRRSAFLAHVLGKDRDVLDQLRAARQEQAADRVALARARDLTQGRQKAAESRLRALQVARDDQRRVKSALDSRIAEFTSEVEALSKEEANLSSLIRAKEAAAPVVKGGVKGAKDAKDVVVGKLSSAGLAWPVRGPVTSGYGMRWGRMHQGIDISAPTGTPIRAAKAGTVITAGSMGGYGNVVIVSHGGGLSTLYAHQSRLGASDGQSVSQGQVIGYVGCTGSCTGAHLHFETRMGGSAQNPMRFLS